MDENTVLVFFLSDKVVKTRRNTKWRTRRKKTILNEICEIKDDATKYKKDTVTSTYSIVYVVECKKQVVLLFSFQP